MTIRPAARGVQIVAVNAFFAALTTIAITLRVYCRVYIQKAFGWDDRCATFAWMFFILYASFAISGAHHGAGQHTWDIRPSSEIPVALKFWWLSEASYVVSHMAIKASIGIALLRLCVRTHHKIVIWIVLILTGIYSVFFFFLFLFQCLPSSFFWTRFTGSSGTCMDPQIIILVFYGYSTITCASDWTLSILPIFLVRDLQMERRDKLFVIIILAVGAIGSSATIARIPYFHNLQNKDDFLRATTDIALCSCTEIALGITAASCMTLRPLLRQFKAFLSFTSPNYRSRTHTQDIRLSHRGKGRSSNRGPYACNLDRIEDDEMKLQEGLEHVQSKNLNTTTSARRSEIERDTEVASNELGPW